LLNLAVPGCPRQVYVRRGGADREYEAGNSVRTGQVLVPSGSGIDYETTAVQLRSFSAGVLTLLSGHQNVDQASVRVRFLRFGASSLDIEIFAYMFAADWNKFLEIQEELLYDIIDMVRKVGAAIAFPTQTLYLESNKLVQATRDYDKRSNREALL
jgi:MscS family membrane protein